MIEPCGIAGCEVTSIERVTGRPAEMALVKNRIVKHFGDVYRRSTYGGPTCGGPTKAEPKIYAAKG